MRVVAFAFFRLVNNPRKVRRRAENQLLADVHDRMPVILSPESYDLWLNPGFRDVAAAAEGLTPFDADLMRRYAVSERVNIVTNDDPECSEPREPPPEAQAALF